MFRWLSKDRNSDGYAEKIAALESRLDEKDTALRGLELQLEEAEAHNVEL